MAGRRNRALFPVTPLEQAIDWALHGKLSSAIDRSLDPFHESRTRAQREADRQLGERVRVKNAELSKDGVDARREIRQLDQTHVDETKRRMKSYRAYRAQHPDASRMDVARHIARTDDPQAAKAMDAWLRRRGL